ncbi:MAG TPA: GGDEF domain-containing protein [Polyangiaceae bacterium]|nr:GGDEF domain-containing protein [Polyangiaceae bacterium]
MLWSVVTHASRLFEALTPKSTAWAAAGALLAAGAPLGLLVLRAIQTRSLDFAWVKSQIQSDPGLYLYLSVATTCVMVVCGYSIGRYEDRLRLRSLTDPLTGLANRRHFVQALATEVARSRRYGAPLTVLLIDIDYFKRVNDRFGHAAGDAALTCVASGLRSSCRQTDLPARYGGDEFALLLPETTAERGLAFAERLAAVLRTAPPYEVGAPSLTLSIGVAEGARGEEAPQLLKRADEALYQAKEGGRNRTVLAATELLAAPSGATSPEA